MNIFGKVFLTQRSTTMVHNVNLKEKVCKSFSYELLSQSRNYLRLTNIFQGIKKEIIIKLTYQ